MKLDEAMQLELQNNKEHDKAYLKKYGENSLYQKLREKGKIYKENSQKAYGVMSIYNYVEMLKAEILKENQ